MQCKICTEKLLTLADFISKTEKLGVLGTLFF